MKGITKKSINAEALPKLRECEEITIIGF